MVYEYRTCDGVAWQGCKQILAIMFRGGCKCLRGTFVYEEMLTDHDMRLV